MGLDCIWQDVDASASEIDPPLHLCGGAFSEHGKGSFRGKVYDKLIKEITGHSLYKELPNVAINEIADILATTTLAMVVSKGFAIGEDEYNDLCRMFRYYGDHGARLVPWY